MVSIFSKFCHLGQKLDVINSELVLVWASRFRLYQILLLSAGLQNIFCKSLGNADLIIHESYNDHKVDIYSVLHICMFIS
jgi:hypothetical protein